MRLHHIGTYCGNVVAAAHEIFASLLRREPLPATPDVIVQYRVGYASNVARREDEYWVEGKEYEEEIASWEDAHPEQWLTRQRNNGSHRAQYAGSPCHRQRIAKSSHQLGRCATIATSRMIGVDYRYSVAGRSLPVGPTQPAFLPDRTRLTFR